MVHEQDVRVHVGRPLRGRETRINRAGNQPDRLVTALNLDTVPRRVRTGRLSDPEQLLKVGIELLECHNEIDYATCADVGIP